ncbi:phage baseplate protein [Pseudomonas sp. NY11955]|uniref:phage baseplate protein n=1 Tax=Pseudomonas sp. NY11955 TaxID=3400363 RepID=UPI003A8C0358
MSIANGVMSIFSKTLPKIDQIEFDAKLEGVTSKAVHLTQFPVEFGANVNDHAILLPDRYLLTGAVSNSPLGMGLGEIGAMGDLGAAIGGASPSSTVGGAVGSAVAAYLLAGSEATRAATAWAALTAMLQARAHFDLITEYETLRDMVLIRLDQRTRPEDEDGLVFVAELQQVRIVKSQVTRGVTSAEQLQKNDPVATQGAPMVSTGSASVEVMQ